MIIDGIGQVLLLDLPCRVGGCTTINDDGSYTIIINARLSLQQQRDALAEELQHIHLGHFCRALTAEQAESEVGISSPDGLEYIRRELWKRNKKTI